MLDLEAGLLIVGRILIEVADARFRRERPALEMARRTPRSGLIHSSDTRSIARPVKTVQRLR